MPFKSKTDVFNKFIGAHSAKSMGQEDINEKAFVKNVYSEALQHEGCITISLYTIKVDALQFIMDF